MVCRDGIVPRARARAARRVSRAGTAAETIASRCSGAAPPSSRPPAPRDRRPARRLRDQRQSRRPSWPGFLPRFPDIVAGVPHPYAVAAMKIPWQGGVRLDTGEAIVGQTYTDEILYHGIQFLDPPRRPTAALTDRDRATDRSVLRPRSGGGAVLPHRPVFPGRQDEGYPTFEDPADADEEVPDRRQLLDVPVDRDRRHPTRRHPNLSTRPVRRRSAWRCSRRRVQRDPHRPVDASSRDGVHGPSGTSDLDRDGDVDLLATFVPESNRDCGAADTSHLRHGEVVDGPPFNGSRQRRDDPLRLNRAPSPCATLAVALAGRREWPAAGRAGRWRPVTERTGVCARRAAVHRPGDDRRLLRRGGHPPALRQPDRRHEDLEVVPAAAESWTVSADLRTFTFVLRPGATFSNGRPVVAGDFAFAFARLADPDLASASGSAAVDRRGLRRRAARGHAPAPSAITRSRGSAARRRPDARDPHDGTVRAASRGARRRRVLPRARRGADRGRCHRSPTRRWGTARTRWWARGSTTRTCPEATRRGAVDAAPAGIQFDSTPTRHPRTDVSVPARSTSPTSRSVESRTRGAKYGDDLVDGPVAALSYLGLPPTAPFTDPDLRRALSLAIDREAITTRIAEGLADRRRAVCRCGRR